MGKWLEHVRAGRGSHAQPIEDQGPDWLALLEARAVVDVPGSK